MVVFHGILWDLPCGKLTVCELEAMAQSKYVEIVDLPIQKAGSVHRLFVNVSQRVSITNH